MRLAESYPVKLVCETLDYPRSRYYRRSEGKDDAALRKAIEEIAGEWPTYGYRRVTAELGRSGWVVNGKRVRRIMSEMGLEGKTYRRKRRTTNSDHPFPRFANLVFGLEITHPDQVWVSDITYVRLRREFVYLAVIMDVFTRCSRGWHLGRGLDQELTLAALRKALEHAVPQIHHSDQGVQYAATAYVSTLRAVGVQISMAEVGQAWQNGYAERLIRTIKEEEVDLSEYEDYQDAYVQIGRFLDDVYMRKRVHSSLGYLTPAEFENQWLWHQAAEAKVT
jgi:transposase InsO family protein